MMEQFENVCKGLEFCIRNPRGVCAKECPYEMLCFYTEGETIKNRLMSDALALIRQQQERIKELEAAIAEWEKFTPFLYAHGMLPEPPKEEDGMKIGDIIINPWVPKEYDGKLNPLYATIYIGDNRSVDYKGRVHRWGDKVYKEGNEREWKVVGHCNPLGWMYEQIIGAIEPPKENA